MKNLNQNKINKMLVMVLIALVAFIGYSRLTEQKRVEYYICYEQLIGAHEDDPDARKAVREHCKERND